MPESMKPTAMIPKACKPAKQLRDKKVRVTRPKTASGTIWGSRPSALVFRTYRLSEGNEPYSRLNETSPFSLFCSQNPTPRSIERFGSRDHAGYPLRQPQLVMLNRDREGVVAELREVSKDLGIRGIGIDEEAAIRDLERLFERLVVEKVRIPPHARRPEDDRIRLVVNHLVDWEQYERENPAPRLVLGRVVGKAGTPSPIVRWFLGPQGERNQTTRLPRGLTSSYFVRLHEGDWFRAVILDYPDRVEWVEPPACCPDPTDPREREKAWQNIPVVPAEEVDVWPLKQG